MKSGPAGEICLAPAVSFVLLPLPLTAVWSFSNGRGIVAAAIGLINALLLAWRWRTARRGSGGGERIQAPAPVEETLATPSRSEALASPRPLAPRIALAPLLLFTGGCVWASLYFPEAGGRTAPRPAHDYVKHHAVLLSLERSPLPLHNYFYAAERDVGYYYYHFHYLVPAAIRKLAGDRVTIGLTFALTSGLLAMVFTAMVYYLAQEWLRGRSRWGAWWAAACVTVVGGWDVIPVAIRTCLGAAPVIVLDSWIPSPWRIHNLMTQFMWCPQHVAGALIVLLAAMWLRQYPQGGRWLALGPLLAVALLGTSVYLAMTVFAAAVVYWASRAIESRRASGRWGWWPAAGVALGLLTSLLTLPQVLGYLEMSRRGVGGLTLAWPRFDYAVLGRLLAPGPAANWLDASWVWMLEFGTLGLAIVCVRSSFWAAVWKDYGLRLLLLSGAAGLAMAYTLRSSHALVDYGFRISVMPAQVFAALAAAALWMPDGARLNSRRALGVVWGIGVALGLPVGLYEAPMMAVRTAFRASPEQQDAGAIHFLRHCTPPDAVLQGSPYDRVSLLQMTDRCLGVADLENSHVRVFYPLDVERLRAACGAVDQALREPRGGRAAATLAAAGVDYVLIGSVERWRGSDPSAFADDEGLERVYADEQAAVFRVRR